MSDAETEKPHHSPLWRVIYFFPAVLVTIWLIFDDVLDAALTPVFGRLSKLTLAIKAERWARGLSPYAALALLIVPAIVIEPAKLFAVYLIGEDHIVSGGLLLIAAFALGIVFVERVFELNRDKILSISWFRYCYEALTSMKLKIYQWVRQSALGHYFAGRFTRRRSSRLA